MAAEASNNKGVVMHALFLTLLTLCLASPAWAQPWGPWTIAELPSGSALHNPQVCLRNSDTADVFYQIGDTVFHVSADVTTGIAASTPMAFPMEGTGWARQLCDVVATNEGWAALVYDTTANLNRTTVFQGHDALGSDSVIDDGEVMYSGEWVSVSINYSLGLTARADSGFFVGWLNWWAYDDPWFWGEDGCGPVVFEFDSEGVVSRQACNGFMGPNRSAGQTLEVYDLSSDSGIVLISEPGWTYIFSIVWDNGAFMPIEPFALFDCGGGSAGALLTHGRTVFVVSRSFVDGQQVPHPGAVLRVDSLSSCTVMRTLSDEPIMAASDPDFGIAWLAWHGPAILLYRADTTGAEFLPPGIMHGPGLDSVVAEAAVGISSGGRIVAVWSERMAGSNHATLLRMKSVGWDTYLGADDGDFAPHASSFILSAFPNPFNGTLKIEYTLPQAGNVEVSVYNVLGQKVETVLDARVESGTHATTWNPESAGGVYFVTMKTETPTRTTKVLYLR